MSKDENFEKLKLFEEFKKLENYLKIGIWGIILKVKGETKVERHVA